MIEELQIEGAITEVVWERAIGAGTGTGTYISQGRGPGGYETKA